MSEHDVKTENLVYQDKHQGVFIINELLNLLKHLCDQFSAL